MSRLSLLLLVAAACGGPSKSPPLAPLPPDKPSEPAPEPVAEKKPPVETPAEPPPAPPGPLEATLTAAKVTVKLVSPGKGKRAALKYTTKAGDKQSVEVAMDFSATQTEAGKKPAEETVPTMVLAGEAETKALDKDVARYTFTVSSTDARPAPGSTLSAEKAEKIAGKFKMVLAAVSGMVVSSSVSSNGTQTDVGMKIEKGSDLAAGALELIKMTWPSLPVLPTEPIAVGAKWQTTATAILAGRLQVTQTTDYELVAKKGTAWTIKGATKVSGADQDVGDGSKITGISGTGTSDVTLVDGALYPTSRNSLETSFTASNPKEGAIAFVLKVGGTITPKK